jgi:hypothetical protein
MQPGGADRLPLVGPGDQNLIGKETLAAGSLRSRLQAHSSMRKCCVSDFPMCMKNRLEKELSGVCHSNWLC